jgi:hypothetical protein
MRDERLEPVVAIEVDGLLSASVTQPGGSPPGEFFETEIVFLRGAYPSGTQPEPAWNSEGIAVVRHWFSRIGMEWVRGLLDDGTAVVWASTWLEYANRYFSLVLGLPDLPVVVTEHQWAGITSGEISARQIASRFDDRPLLFVTDMLPQTGRRHLERLRRPRDRALTRLHYIPWSSSPSAGDVRAMDHWLCLARTTEGQSELSRVRRLDLERTRQSRR